MGEEQRQFPRITESLTAQCRVLGDLSELWRTVRTVDFSATGMRLQSEQPIDETQAMDLRLQVPGLHDVVELRVHIVRMIVLPSGVTEVAVEFIIVSPEQQELIDKLVRFLKLRS